MSGTDAQSAIEKEYEEAEMTACGYLLAASVLELDEVSMPQFRERQIRRIENLLLKDGIVEKVLPDDPDASEACMLAIRLLRGDDDPEILDTLLSNASNPTYEIVLEALKRSMLAMGADIPDRLRMWEPESNNVKKRRLRKNPARNHRIGMVVEALVMGNNILTRKKKSERKLERQQREPDLLRADMAAISEEAGKPFKELPNEYFIEHLNKMGARPWRTWNGGKGLTEREMVELSKQPVLMAEGINAVMPQFRWLSEDDLVEPTKQ